MIYSYDSVVLCDGPPNNEFSKSDGPPNKEFSIQGVRLEKSVID